MEEFTLIAKTFQGLEEVLAKELTHLGANNIEIGNRMVSFTGDKAMMYKANFALRTALRILKPIKTFKAENADEVYEKVKNMPWEEIMDETMTFAVDATVYSSEFRHSQFVSYRVKDAIVDRFREKKGVRPNVKVSNPDLYINIHIAETDCTVSLDSSGESLHRRGYRQQTLEAPLNEVLAAGMILMTGWDGECDLIDPMCGSGTILIEAALIARNIAPGVFRQEYAFERWKDFDKELLEAIFNDDSEEREFGHRIWGYDIQQKAILVSALNAKAAGVTRDITLTCRDIADFTQPEDKAIIITNPPYGERITTDDLLGLYSTLGTKLKHEFMGGEAWIISYREECFAKIGLKPSVKIELNNGPLECEFRKYEMFDGTFKKFKEDNGNLDKSERPQGKYRSLSSRQDRSRKTDALSMRRRSQDGEEEESQEREFRHEGFHRQERNFRKGPGKDFGPSRERGFRHDDGESPRRSFRKDDGDAPRRSFRKNDGETPRRSFRKDDGEAPRRSFRHDGGEAPRRSFRHDGGEAPGRSFRHDGGDAPGRSFRHDDGDAPRRSFRKDGGDAPRRSFRKDSDRPGGFSRREGRPSAPRDRKDRQEERRRIFQKNDSRE